MSDTTTFVRPIGARPSSWARRRRLKHSSDTVRLFRGNTSDTADRVVSSNYESKHRIFEKLETLLPVAAWFFPYDRPPVRGTPVNATTRQIDTYGLLLEVRLPEPHWAAALLTGKMNARMGITLPDFRERIVVTAHAGWMEAHEPLEPLKIGFQFQDLSERDYHRIKRLLLDDRRRKEMKAGKNEARGEAFWSFGT